MPRATMVLQTRDLRVVERESDDSDERSTYGCTLPYLRDPARIRRRGYRKRALVFEDDCHFGCGGSIVASSTYVAWSTGACSPGNGLGCFGAVGVTDVRTRRRSSVSTATQGVHGLDVTGKGTAVWIESTADDPDQVYRVEGLTLGDEQLLFDAGADIDRDSLALGGPTLYWTRAGTPRTAQVP